MKKKAIIAAVLGAAICLLSACGANEEPTSADGNNTDISAIVAKYEENGHPIAVIEMQDGGVIVLELYEDIAPNTVNNFISLANKGFYDGTVFHRVIQGFMIQGGDPKGNGTGGPGYCIPGEFSNNDFKNTISHTRGTISMGRRGSQYADYMYYDTAGCQFFICDADSTFLDGNYASFGRVVEGMDVVDRIAAVQKNSSDKPLKDQVMSKVYVETFGKTYAEPVTLAE